MHIVSLFEIEGTRWRIMAESLGGRSGAGVFSDG